MIRSLRFDDLLLERALDDAGKDSDEFAQADASFVLMIPTFREFIPQLLEALGGEESPQGIDGAYNEPEPAPGAGIDVTKALGMRDGITATLHIPRANGPGDDPLLKEAIRFVRETRRASISAIQRKLKIGYNRAVRLVEEIYRRADEGRRISRGSVVKSPPPPTTQNETLGHIRAFWAEKGYAPTVAEMAATPVRHPAAPDRPREQRPHPARPEGGAQYPPALTPPAERPTRGAFSPSTHRKPPCGRSNYVP